MEVEAAVHLLERRHAQINHFLLEVGQVRDKAGRDLELVGLGDLDIGAVRQAHQQLAAVDVNQLELLAFAENPGVDDLRLDVHGKDRDWNVLDFLICEGENPRVVAVADYISGISAIQTLSPHQH